LRIIVHSLAHLWSAHDETELFARDQPGRSPSGNLGLGLYIAKQIVLSHGGPIAAHSVDGTTTVAMRLPRRPASRRTAQAE
jgi:signal transduction histidine kinase